MTVTRRNVIEWGLGTLATALARPTVHASSPKGTARACIVLFMGGGPSQLDTFDPKPGRETGGPFKAMRTSVTGVRVSEHLPQLAGRMRRLAVIRSLTSTEGSHARARYLIHTGYRGRGNVQHPALGAHVARAGTLGPLPGYVAIGGPGHPAGLLGAALAPTVVMDPTRPVRNIAAPLSLPADARKRRLQLWRDLQSEFAAGHPGEVTQGHAEIMEQAVRMSTSAEVESFDLTREPVSLRERYGMTKFGQGCLMARRLVESGVPFVEVTLPGWDTHRDNFTRVQRLSADLDAGMSTLIDDLRARGLLESTLVLWVGEFGRTPRINASAGRDHFAKAFSAVLAGGGVVGGRVVGATDRNGMAIAERPVTVPDLFRTIAHLVGFDPEQTYTSAEGRPIKAVDGGTVVRELL